ncbi:oxygenase MpaB family protein [Sphingomonas montanisoli]|nr:oxygenase MpaB family protein [Sphingomonas montanisoli]
MVSRVVGLFNDRARGEAPVLRSEAALFSSGSVIWRVHGDVTTMMIGGVTALLLQMLHPAALTGVWEHSHFRDDMLGRLRRTARFIALTTFGERSLADEAIARVRAIHARVSGVMPDGQAYRADDPALLAWIHVAEATGFLDAWIAYGEPAMSIADQDVYFAESAVVARALGADPVPTTRAEATALLQRYRPDLAVDHRTRAVARLILHPKPTSLADLPVQALLMRAAIDLLPPWARRMQGLSRSGVTSPLVHGGASALAETLRWAFAGRA